MSNQHNLLQQLLRGRTRGVTTSTITPHGVSPASVIFPNIDAQVLNRVEFDQRHRPTCVRCHFTGDSPDRLTTLCCKFNFLTELLKNMSINVPPTGDMKRGGITYGDPVTSGEDPTGAHLGLRMIAAAISLCLLLGVTLFLFHITKRKRLNATLRREQREQRALYRRHLPLSLPYHDCGGEELGREFGVGPLPPPYPLICGGVGGGGSSSPKAPDDPPPPYEVGMYGGGEEGGGGEELVQQTSGYIAWNPASLMPPYSGHVSAAADQQESERFSLLPPVTNSWYPLPLAVPLSLISTAAATSYPLVVPSQADPPPVVMGSSSLVHQHHDVPASSPDHPEFTATPVAAATVVDMNKITFFKEYEFIDGQQQVEQAASGSPLPASEVANVNDRNPNFQEVNNSVLASSANRQSDV